MAPLRTPGPVPRVPWWRRAFGALWRSLSPTARDLIQLLPLVLVVLALVLVLLHLAPDFRLPIGANAAPLVAADATPTDTPAPTPAPTVLPTATPIPPPPIQLVFDQASAESDHSSATSTYYYIRLTFHTSPARPGDYANYRVTACGQEVWSSVGSHLDGGGAQSYVSPFRSSCVRPFGMSVTATSLVTDSGATYALSGSATFTVTS
jgi:hypothetical protein